MDLAMIRITNNFHVNVNLKIVVVILLDQKVDGELTKNLKKIQELVDNFFKI